MGIVMLCNFLYIETMDTDFLTREAYRVLIGRSGEVSEFLRAEIGASASRYQDEDTYLVAMRKFVLNIANNPEGYLDSWNLIDEIDPDEFGTQAHKLANDILAVSKTPLDKRGPADE